MPLENQIGDRPSQPVGENKTAQFSWFDIFEVPQRLLPPQPEADTPEAERAAIRDKITRGFRDTSMFPDRAGNIRNYMHKFEQRYEDFVDYFKGDGMNENCAKIAAQQQIIETYKRVDELLRARDNASVPLTRDDRVRIAEQILAHAAEPTRIDQGYHNTCNVSTVETRAYTRHPAEAAALVTSIATTGAYTMKDGTRVVPKPDNVKPHDEALSQYPPDGTRGLASQIFQVTAINAFWTKNNATIEYLQQDRPAGGDPGDTGERLMDNSANPPREWKNGDKPARNPGMDDQHLIWISKMVTGETRPVELIVHAGLGKQGVKNIASEQELNNALAEAKRTNNFPVIIAVHTGNEPFFKDSGAGAAGGSGGRHVVTITDYIPGPPAKVELDNQWGTSSDHLGAKAVPTKELFLSMQDPKDPEGWAYRSAQLKQINEGVRSGSVSRADADAITGFHITGAAKDWKADPNSDAAKQGKKELEKLIGQQPNADTRLNLIHSAWKEGLLTNDEVAVWYAQQQCRLIRGAAFGGTDPEAAEKTYAALETFSNELPRAQQELFQKRAQTYLYDAFSTHENHPYPG